TFTDTFTPNYITQFPEYFLTGIQTETLMRDLAPVGSSIYGVTHGKVPSAVASQLWLTEYNLDGSDAAWYSQMTQAEVEHFRAKTALRSLLAYINKGADV